MSKKTLLLAGIALVVSLPIPAAEVARNLPPGFDLRATDAVDIFSAMCVATSGDRGNAMQVLGAGNAIANRLPDEAVAASQGGRVGGVAWAMQSPNGARFLLEYDPVGLCGVRLIEADEPSLRAAFSALAQAASSVAGAKLKTARPKMRMQDGARVTTKDYSYPVPGHIAHLMITTSDKKVAAQQHYLTFTFSKPD